MFNERNLKAPIISEVTYDQTLGTLVENGSTLHSIQGIAYIKDYLTVQEQESLITTIDSHSFTSVIQRRQQFYGSVYYHTKTDNSLLQPSSNSSSVPFTLEPFLPLLNKTADLFTTLPPNQILINEYRGSTGIRSHFEDEDSFGDTIVTISLNEPIWMTLKRPLHHLNSCPMIISFVRILLQPRSCFIMSSECRYEWRHGITKAKNIQVDLDTFVPRDENYRRLSMTIRYLKEERKKVNKEDNVVEWKDSDPRQGESCEC